MQKHDAEAHAESHELMKLRNALRAKDQEIAALKAVIERTGGVHDGSQVMQEQLEGEGHSVSADDHSKDSDTDKENDNGERPSRSIVTKEAKEQKSSADHDRS